MKGRYDIARVAGFIVPSIPVIIGIIRPRSGLIVAVVIVIERYHRARVAGSIFLAPTITGREY